MVQQTMSLLCAGRKERSHLLTLSPLGPASLWSSVRGKPNILQSPPGTGWVCPHPQGLGLGRGGDQEGLLGSLLQQENRFPSDSRLCSVKNSKERRYVLSLPKPPTTNSECVGSPLLSLFSKTGLRRGQPGRLCYKGAFCREGAECVSTQQNFKERDKCPTNDKILQNKIF